MLGTSSEIAVMGGDGAVNIIYRRKIAEAEDPEAKRQELLEEYKDQFLSPYLAADLGYIDVVIFPDQTRKILVRAFDSLDKKRDQNPPKKVWKYPVIKQPRDDDGSHLISMLRLSKDL